jgi:hypothetical protein
MRWVHLPSDLSQLETRSALTLMAEGPSPKARRRLDPRKAESAGASRHKLAQKHRADTAAT